MFKYSIKMAVLFFFFFVVVFINKHRMKVCSFKSQELFSKKQGTNQVWLVTVIDEIL